MLSKGLRKVVVGMSGGVDSSVSALLLSKRNGWEVEGAFMRNWDAIDETGVCTADKDCAAAEGVAKKLGIKFHMVDFVKEYWNEVFEELIAGYSGGLTPNPDILCNSRIKFRHFFEHARQKIGCDAIATGHYARNSLGEDLLEVEGRPAFLLKSYDRTKDQTFFLSQMPQEALRRTIFPVGELTKPVVKEIARQAGFTEIADKKESMGICFVGKKRAPGNRGFQEFIADYVPARPGNFIDIDTGQVVGQHQGVHQWTVGQRAKIQRSQEPYVVVAKDPASSNIHVAADMDHPALFAESFFTGEPHWISGAPEELTMRSSDKSLACEYRSQNVAPLTKCLVSYSMSSTSGGNWEYVDRKSLVVSLAEPARAITPGQFAAFYKGDVCLGSSMILRAGPSLYTLNTANCRTNRLRR